ncbi:MAG: acetyl-CoA carboxylase carboxyl transferase subunit alpha [Eubacterium sp.]|nr:acetyl-CoA carboxylase carboxyl transferase subunit alpha [Eubacterium sp.]
MTDERTVTAYDRVALARNRTRPTITDYIDALFKGFIELKGDRLGREDPAVLGGIASFHGIPVTVIGHRKGRDTEENIRFNFGMASPEGYRKSLRLMQQAEKFRRPVITFIDTPGAYPGMEAESSGQANAIAENLAYMSIMKTPVIAVITGEGNSGGALALAVADRVYMHENAVYSVLSPEGFASIMWKDSKRAAEASEVMKLTAQDIYSQGLIDGIINESRLFKELDRQISEDLQVLMKMPAGRLIRDRYRKFRTIDGPYRPS